MCRYSKPFQLRSQACLITTLGRTKQAEARRPEACARPQERRPQAWRVADRPGSGADLRGACERDRHRHGRRWLSGARLRRGCAHWIGGLIVLEP